MNRPKSPVLKKRVIKKPSPPVATDAVVETLAENDFKNNEEIHEETKQTNKQSLSESSYMPSKTYPPAIQSIIDVCLKEDVKAQLKGRIRGEYLKIFEKYKSNLAPRDYSIIQGGLIFLYTYSRVNSIDETYAKWMIGIFEIPKSHIVAYTSKKILERVAKSVGVSSTGKAEDLVERIRTVIDPSV
ncbi:MAG: hypothetical protein ACRDAQ_10875 [Cetobacterium sp.]